MWISQPVYGTATDIDITTHTHISMGTADWSLVRSLSKQRLYHITLYNTSKCCLPIESFSAKLVYTSRNQYCSSHFRYSQMTVQILYSSVVKSTYIKSSLQSTLKMAACRELHKTYKKRRIMNCENGRFDNYKKQTINVKSSDRNKCFYSS